MDGWVSLHYSGTVKRVFLGSRHQEALWPRRADGLCVERVEIDKCMIPKFVRGMTKQTRLETPKYFL